ncbi:hypothetical protein PR048_003828 [Dryococelus australis]|uniref:Uncharacterized protein n=1 Tax=Dryococelus australis TaxID=614101 RepID=A0ABQ9IP69_9NEOP|nr:hypothetical protein PR048_003828 [Dryococelus australis]
MCIHVYRLSGDRIDDGLAPIYSIFSKNHCGHGDQTVCHLLVECPQLSYPGPTDDIKDVSAADAIKWSNEEIWTALNIEVLRADEGEARLVWSSAGLKGRGKRKIPEKTRRPAASSGTIPTSGNPGDPRPGLNPVRHGGRRARLSLHGAEESPGSRTSSRASGMFVAMTTEDTGNGQVPEYLWNRTARNYVYSLLNLVYIGMRTLSENFHISGFVYMHKSSTVSLEWHVNEVTMLTTMLNVRIVRRELPLGTRDPCYRVMHAVGGDQPRPARQTHSLLRRPWQGDDGQPAWPTSQPLLPCRRSRRRGRMSKNILAILFSRRNAAFGEDSGPEPTTPKAVRCFQDVVDTRNSASVYASCAEPRKQHIQPKAVRCLQDVVDTRNSASVYASCAEPRKQHIQPKAVRCLQDVVDTRNSASVYSEMGKMLFPSAVFKMRVRYVQNYLSLSDMDILNCRRNDNYLVTVAKKASCRLGIVRARNGDFPYFVCTYLTPFFVITDCVFVYLLYVQHDDEDTSPSLARRGDGALDTRGNVALIPPALSLLKIRGDCAQAMQLDKHERLHGESQAILRETNRGIGLGNNNLYAHQRNVTRGASNLPDGQSERHRSVTGFRAELLISGRVPSDRRRVAREMASGREICDCEYQAVKEHNLRVVKAIGTYFLSGSRSFVYRHRTPPDITTYSQSAALAGEVSTSPSWIYIRISRGLCSCASKVKKRGSDIRATLTRTPSTSSTKLTTGTNITDLNYVDAGDSVQEIPAIKQAPLDLQIRTQKPLTSGKSYQWSSATSGSVVFIDTVYSGPRVRVVLGESLAHVYEMQDWRRWRLHLPYVMPSPIITATSGSAVTCEVASGRRSWPVCKSYSQLPVTKLDLTSESTCEIANLDDIGTLKAINILVPIFMGASVKQNCETIRINILQIREIVYQNKQKARDISVFTNPDPTLVIQRDNMKLVSHCADADQWPSIARNSATRPLSNSRPAAELSYAPGGRAVTRPGTKVPITSMVGCNRKCSPTHLGQIIEPVAGCSVSAGHRARVHSCLTVVDILIELHAAIGEGVEILTGVGFSSAQLNMNSLYVVRVLAQRGLLLPSCSQFRTRSSALVLVRSHVACTFSRARGSIHARAHREGKRRYVLCSCIDDDRILQPQRTYVGRRYHLAFELRTKVDDVRKVQNKPRPSQTHLACFTDCASNQICAVAESRRTVIRDVKNLTCVKNVPPRAEIYKGKPPRVRTHALLTVGGFNFRGYLFKNVLVQCPSALSDTRGAADLLDRASQLRASLQ